MTIETWENAETVKAIRLENVSLSFQNNQFILDIRDIDTFSKKEYEKTIRELNILFQDEKKPSKPMTLAEKIDFYFKRRAKTPFLFRDIELVTRINGKVHLVTRYQIEGDIKYVDATPKTRKTQDYLYQIHQAMVKLYMKNWRDSVIFYGEQIEVIIKTITQIQVTSSALGALTYLAGLINNTPSYQVMSIIPIILAVMMTIIKRKI